MFQSIVKTSIDDMKKDRKIIRLTFATSFFHSLIASLLILLNTNALFAKNYENGLYVGKVAEFFVQEINTNHVISRVLWIAIIGFLIYSIVYPIGQAAIIHYLHNPKIGIKNALKKWKDDFFPMFEFGIFSLITSPTVYRLSVFKIIISKSNIWPTTIRLLILWFGALTIINALKAYTRYIITLEKKWVYEAIIESSQITLNNLKKSFKYIRIQTILIINFSLNIAYIYILPITLIYLAIITNSIQYGPIKWITYGLFWWWIVFGAYASSIVRAFFAYFWQEIYTNIHKKR